MISHARAWYTKGLRCGVSSAPQGIGRHCSGEGHRRSRGQIELGQCNARNQDTPGFPLHLLFLQLSFADSFSLFQTNKNTKKKSIDCATQSCKSPFITAYYATYQHEDAIWVLPALRTQTRLFAYAEDFAFSLQSNFATSVHSTS